MVSDRLSKLNVSKGPFNIVLNQSDAKTLASLASINHDFHRVLQKYIDMIPKPNTRITEMRPEIRFRQFTQAESRDNDNKKSHLFRLRLMYGLFFVIGAVFEADDQFRFGANTGSYERPTAITFLSLALFGCILDILISKLKKNSFERKLTQWEKVSLAYRRYPHLGLFNPARINLPEISAHREAKNIPKPIKPNEDSDDIENQYVLLEEKKSSKNSIINKY